MEKYHDEFSEFEFLNARFLFAALAIVATLAFVSGAAFGADKTPRADDAELRIQDMRTNAQPVYIPPPVYYEPRQSLGISLLFSLDLRQREDRPRR